jgi:hypothetical protein
MPNSAITTKIHEAFDVHGYFTPKIAFDYEFGYLSAQIVDLSFI